MDLRQKLAFLRAPTPSQLPPAEPLLASHDAQPNTDIEPTGLPSEGDRDPAVMPEAPASTGEEPEAREQALAELRGKIDKILGRAVSSRANAELAESSLPFARIERDEGVLHQRLERLSLSHHVGKMPVDSALGANAELVALLALDPTLAGVRYERALFLDTETTGLGGGAGVLAFLVGMSWFDAENRLFIEQLLLRRPADERALLARVRECLERAEVVVTYNGKSFDLPLLATRCVMNHLPPLPVRPHLDLLHVARRLHGKRIGACRLVSLESEVLGFGRGPDVEGADIAARYGHFLRTGDDSGLEAVVGHNAWDVVSMAALVGLYGEPIGLLPGQDLVGMARTLRRAGALEQAAAVAETAVERGGGVDARRARGDIAKARGDRARALAEFEALAVEVDNPSLRLELSKLYEHFLKEPGLALDLVERGTGEKPPAEARRRERLQRKATDAAAKRQR